MSRYQNKGETVDEIPHDWLLRWDATDKSGIGYLTNEATNDIDSWTSQEGPEALGTVELVDVDVTSNYPEWVRDVDGYPCVHFQRDGCLARDNLSTYNADLHARLDDASSVTVIVVARHNDVLNAGAGNSFYWHGCNDHSGGLVGTNGSVDPYSNGIYHTATNTFDERRFIVGFRNQHNGTDDNDQAVNLGKTSLYTVSTIADSACQGGNNLTMGSYATGASSAWDADCNIYETIVFGRSLSDAEYDNWVDYLSAKWGTTNADNSSDTITSSTERTWVSRTPDRAGHAITSYTPINHRVEPLQNVDSPKDADNRDDGLFPSSLDNLQCWFRSDHTGGMTFATGDATSGGTVSSWTDITGNYTMNTATSGDSAVDWHPSGYVKGGFPSVEGGTVASPKSLESTAAVSFVVSTGEQRLYWSVGTFGDASLQTTFCAPGGNNYFPATFDAFSGDMVDKPVTLAMDAAPQGIWQIQDAGSPADDGRIHITVSRWTQGATTDNLESWYAGLKMPLRTSLSIRAGQPVSVGAVPASTFDAHGAQMLEMGLAGATAAVAQTYSDADVENLIQYLCARYNVDYMPTNTPITIGAWSRSSDSLAQTDCCLWHDPSTLGAEHWPLHPNVAQYHTTPLNFEMVTGAETTAVGMSLVSGALGHTAVQADETVTANQHMEMSNSYSTTETTDFPADTDGMSSFQVWYLDSATTTSNGACCGNNISYGRTSGTSNTDIQHYSSDKVVTHTGQQDNWLVTGTSYAYDDDGTGSQGYPGSTDGTPAVYFYCNDDTMQAVDDSAATSFSVQNFVNWDTADGSCQVLEQVVFKHPLTIEEITELKKYFQFKYGDAFDD